MSQASIPVDLFNPGQVFACLGFLEAAEILCGDAEGGFDWSDPSDVRFALVVPGASDVVSKVLTFLEAARVQQVTPRGYQQAQAEPDESEGEGLPEDTDAITDASEFPAPSGDRMSLPIRLVAGERYIDLEHWTRGDFKLYSGNRSGFSIAQRMLDATRALWKASPDALVASPLGVLCQMGGSFNFDPRGSWTAIDAGYSPDRLKHMVLSSPVVELMSALAMQHAQPQQEPGRVVIYHVWNSVLPLALARAALGGARFTAGTRRFRFQLAMAGKNKVVTFASEETP